MIDSPSQVRLSTSGYFLNHVVSVRCSRPGSSRIRPQTGIDDPAYRLFAVIGHCAWYYLISYRTSRSCHTLDNGRCINYEPGQPLNVRNTDYRRLLNVALKGESEIVDPILNTYIEY